MAVRIPIVADVGDWLRGTRRVSDDLDQLADDLRDTARTGQRTTDDLADAFDRFARQTDAAMDRAARSVDTSMRRMGDDTDRTMQELQDEAGQTAAEVSASFDGSWTSIAGGAQELLAQSSRVFTGIGGLIVGLGGGAVIGTVLTALDTWQQKQQEIRDRAAEYAQALAEANGYIGKQITDQVTLNATQDLSASELQSIVSLANQLGVPWRDLITSAVTTNDTLAAQRALHDEIETRQRNRVGLSLEEGAQADAIIGQLQAQEDLYGTMNDALGVSQRAWEDTATLAGDLRVNTEASLGPLDSASARARTLSGHMRDARTAWDGIADKSVTVTARFRTDVYASTPGLPDYILRNVNVSEGRP